MPIMYHNLHEFTNIVCLNLLDICACTNNNAVNSVCIQELNMCVALFSVLNFSVYLYH